MAKIRGNTKENLDSAARQILAAETTEGKTAALDKIFEDVREQSRKELLAEKESVYRRRFTTLVIVIFLATNLLIGFVVLTAFSNDMSLYDPTTGYVRIIDAKVIIALITGVVVQTAASFGILTRYMYQQKED